MIPDNEFSEQFTGDMKDLDEAQIISRESIWRKIARVKGVGIRFAVYGNILQLILLFLLAGWHNWYLLLPFAIWAAWWFETRHGIYGEMSVAWTRSEDWAKFLVEFRRMNSNLVEMKRNLDKLSWMGLEKKK